MPSPQLVYFVNSLEDNNNEGTLRNALNQSKSNPNSLIIFAVAGVITLNSSLPTITSTVTLDATNAPGYAGVPVVEINCNGYNGLVFECNSGNSRVQALSITNAGNSGIVIKSNGNIIISNYIGIDLQGNPKGNKKNGICVCKSLGNTIGDNPNNQSAYASNVISANGENGIKLFKSSKNTIVSNFIGSNASGTLAYPNKLNGILLTDCSNENMIGGNVYTNSDGQTNNPTGSKGTEPVVYIFPPLGNLISGNKGNGVLIEKSSNKNLFNGNFIGVNSSGIVPLGNGINGVCVNSSNDTVLRGCLVDENPFVYYNVCSGNNQNGIRVTNSNNTVIQGNFFGIGANNATIVSNKMNGILIDGTSNNTTDGGVIPLGNVSAGNGQNGIYLTDSVSNYISFNTFGGLFAFTVAAPNGENGALVDSTGSNIVFRTNVFSGNVKNGIRLVGNSKSVTVESAIVGLVTDGDLPLPNGSDGLYIGENSSNNIIGVNVPSVIPRSAFSGNGGNGVHISDNANNNQVNLAFCGLSVLGLNTGAQNNINGVLIDGNANNNYVGKTYPDLTAFTNYSSTNLQYGVQLAGDCYENVIDGNIIGFDINNESAPNLAGAISNISSKADTNIIINNVTN